MRLDIICTVLFVCLRNLNNFIFVSAIVQSSPPSIPLSKDFGNDTIGSRDRYYPFSKVVGQTADLNFMIYVKFSQESGNQGTLVSFVTSSDAKTTQRALEVVSDGPNNQLVIKYIAINDALSRRTISFPAALDDADMHKLFVQFKTENGRTNFQIIIDCALVLNKTFTQIDGVALNQTTRLYYGQSNLYSGYFVGALNELKVLPNSAIQHHVRDQCPDLEQGTENDHRVEDWKEHFCPKCFRVFQIQIDSLQRQVEKLEREQSGENSRIQQLQLSLMGCSFHGTSRLDDGQVVTDKDSCRKYTCHMGRLINETIGCKKLNCANPIKLENQCCPICAQKCYQGDVAFEYLETKDIKRKTSSCLRCKCLGSFEHPKLDCKIFQKFHQDFCPALNCLEANQVEVSGSCCKVCNNYDPCVENARYRKSGAISQLEGPCGADAVCITDTTTHMHRCECKTGFFGDGINCFDIDECYTRSDKTTICGVGAKCINKRGSYNCHCLLGYAKLDGECFNMIPHYK